MGLQHIAARGIRSNLVYMSPVVIELRTRRIKRLRRFCGWISTSQGRCFHEQDLASKPALRIESVVTSLSLAVQEWYPTVSSMQPTNHMD